MSKIYTTNSLIEAVKRRAMLPQTNATFKEEDFLAFANEELDIGVAPLIMSFHEDYLMRTVEIPLTANQPRYVIPSRAMGNKIREVQYKDDGGILYEMTRIFIEDLPYFQAGAGGSSYGSIRSFYLEGNEIVLTPNSSGNFVGSLRVSYYTRCSEIVSEDRVARITDINTTTGVVTMDDYPEAFPSVTGTLIDFTSSSSPFMIIGMDLQPTALGTPSAPMLTFNPADLSDRLKVGDIVSLAEETIIPQVPTELRSILVQRMAICCLEALGDAQGAATAAAKLALMEEKAGNILDDRSEGSPLKIAPKNTFLRRSRTYLRR